MAFVFGVLGKSSLYFFGMTDRGAQDATALLALLGDVLLM